MIKQPFMGRDSTGVAHGLEGRIEGAFGSWLMLCADAVVRWGFSLSWPCAGLDTIYFISGQHAHCSKCCFVGVNCARVPRVRMR